MKIIQDDKYGSHEWEYVDWYLPETDSFDTVIWFHGGGLEAGTRKSLAFQKDLADRDIAVASVEYRMYPQAHFPDYLIDSANAVRYCIERAKQLGGNRVYVSGQSAGAYITLMLCLNEAYFRNAGVDRADIAGYISDSAQVTTHFNILRERGIDSRCERIDEAAPLFYVSANTHYPALLLIWYEEDMPCRGAQNVLFYQSLKRICPGLRTEMITLPGGHTHGSVERNKAGTFDYVDQVIRFIAG